MARNARIYLIADEEHGFTIVVTDPATVLHYTIEDLQPTLPGGPVTLNPGSFPPKTAMAIAMQEIILLLRGNNVDDFIGKPGNYDPQEWRRELEHSSGIARQILDGAKHSNVDFCLAFGVNDDAWARGNRNFEPAKSVGEALQAESDFKKPPSLEGVMNLRSELTIRPIPKPKEEPKPIKK